MRIISQQWNAPLWRNCRVRNRTKPDYNRTHSTHCLAQKHKKMSKIFLRVHVHSTMEEEKMANRWITDYKVQLEKTSDALCRYDFSVSQSVMIEASYKSRPIGHPRQQVFVIQKRAASTRSTATSSLVLHPPRVADNQSLLQKHFGQQAKPPRDRGSLPRWTTVLYALCRPTSPAAHATPSPVGCQVL